MSEPGKDREPIIPNPPPQASEADPPESIDSDSVEPEPSPAIKGEFFARIALSTGLSREQVASVFDALTEEAKQAVGRGGRGTFTVPGLVRIVVVVKPATKERRGINPFTKEEQTFKAMPERRVVKVRPLKTLLGFAE